MPAGYHVLGESPSQFNSPSAVSLVVFCKNSAPSIPGFDASTNQKKHAFSNGMRCFLHSVIRPFVGEFILILFIDIQ
jgi:hypothetical protein